ncbi:hypothetical protein GCM10009731_62100 [Streptomyces globosus]
MQLARGVGRPAHGVHRGTAVLAPGIADHDNVLSVPVEGGGRGRGRRSEELQLRGTALECARRKGLLHVVLLKLRYSVAARPDGIPAPPAGPVWGRVARTQAAGPGGGVASRPGPDVSCGWRQR